MIYTGTLLIRNQLPDRARITLFQIWVSCLLGKSWDLNVIYRGPHVKLIFFDQQFHRQSSQEASRRILRGSEHVDRAAKASGGLERWTDPENRSPQQ